MPRAKKVPKVHGSFLVIGDAHQGAKLFNLPELEADLRQDLANAVTKAIELNVEYFILVGDTYQDNWPDQGTVDFVTEQRERLERYGIVPLAICGDHDKPIQGTSWIHNINRFHPVSEATNFLGVDYDDNPENVMKRLEEQWKAHTQGVDPMPLPVHWIFMHGQVKELWPFCEEKKLLPLKEWFLSHNLPELKGIILGDIHKPFEDKFLNPRTNQEIYVGYTGSLGVTRLDELDKKGYLHFDGQELKRVEYNLERKFIEINVTIPWLDGLNAEERKKSVDTLKAHDKKPVVILKYTKDTVDRIHELAFLYDYAVVRPTRVKQQDGQEQTINIRSEIKTDDKIENTLRQVEILKSEDAFNLALQLLKNPDGAKTTLDKFKETQLA
jgi:DNA repair exonuclease SbcCD nuclease subunit